MAKAFSRETTEVRRAALIAATLASLADRGLGAVSVRDVAKRAGVSPGLIRHHFGGFSNLLAEAYATVVAQVDAALDQAVAAAGDDPDLRMHAFVEASFSETVVDRDLLSAWLGFWGLVRTDPVTAAKHGETYVAYRRRLEGLLEDMATARERPLDLRLSAIGLSALLDGLWLELCLDPSTFSRNEAMQIAARWVKAELA
ncbi:transcriptional regulator BetI [Caulobacter sp. S45]|uniref:transcriptional regulator BetI n=1 Tax=Caulobacter sp. S45 TaxID=1641861 RepID=UPI00131CE17D|nr:transcriptional regulator BetI [Caulobacter sp. S45]